MRPLVILTGAVSLYALGVSGLSAKSQRRVRRHCAAFHALCLNATTATLKATGIPMKLPLGPARWWDRMLRENRLTWCN